MTDLRPETARDKTDERKVCPDFPEPKRANTLLSTPMVHWFSPPLLFQVAVRDLLSRLFALYADKRAILAALDPGKVFLDEWRERDPLWFDFVADLGDGWNSTYTIAHALSQKDLRISWEGRKETLSRGALLFMGGDEVYPYATAADYKRKMKGPYQAALPCVIDEVPPHLFAIPGNHDWADGLSNFQRFYCQERWIGGRKTAQSQSYFAIRMPHGWWLWGIDTQLDSYIDRPQLEYFRKAAREHMQDGDQVILVLPEPSWVYAATTNGELHRNVAWLERDVILPHGGDLRVCLTGDLHHYAAYSETDSKGVPVENGRVRLTCGGGGAFTHGTHHLPQELDLAEADGTRHYSLNPATHPSAEDSRHLLLGNLIFPLRNPSFAVGVGLIYLLFAVLLQHAGKDGGPGLLEQLRHIPLASSSLNSMARLFGAHLLYSPTGIFLSLVLILVLAAFASPDWSKYKGSRFGERLVAGFIHATMHMGAFILATWLVAHWTAFVLPLRLPDWQSLLKFALAEFLVGGIAGAFVFGVYLYASNRVFGYHRTEAFSSLRTQDFKSFLRLRIDESGLTIWPVGIRLVSRRWRRRGSDLPPEASWFEPQGGSPLKLIHAPIHVSTRKLRGVDREPGRGT